MKTQFHSHDLTLPDWGPYSKHYSGISHIPDVSRGIRFDLAVFPGLDNYRSEVPSVYYYSGYHVWDADSDLSRYTLRHELLWKDLVYTDIDFLALNSNTRLIQTHCHNNSDQSQSLCMNYAASAWYPTASNSRTVLSGADVQLPEDGCLVLAADYQDLRFAHPRLRDSLCWDGQRRAEEPRPGSVQGYVIAQGFGEAGDWVSYRFFLKKPLQEPVLCVRYWNRGSTPAVFRLSTGEELVLPPTQTPDISWVPLSKEVPQGQLDLELTALQGEDLALDCLILCEDRNRELIQIQPRHEIIQGRPELHNQKNFLLIQYPQADMWYGFVWSGPEVGIREHHASDLEGCIRFLGRDPVSAMPMSDHKGHYIHILQRPIVLEPGQSQTVTSAICSGKTKQEVLERCEVLRHNLSAFPIGQLENHGLECLAAGEKYRLSQQLMRAMLHTNVVYPVYTRGQFIRHNTPGRIWDSLYTWDSGFAGMGLMQSSLQRAFECLDAYLTPPGDDETAFIHHGSLVPTQFYLFAELLSRTCSEELLIYCYPRLQQYYEFMIGRAESSTLANLKSGLLRPWDYFYNSGGWDDYPPQKEIHEKKMEQSAAPVVTSAHMIRCAKIMEYCAQRLKKPHDAAVFRADIIRLADALQQLSWDEESGYFGYVLHDEAGEPCGILRSQNNENFNKGLGGVSPLFADICTPSQAKRMWAHLESDKELWCSCGLSTVDQSASYYRDDGYWNGAVWMPYQWMYFKAALDSSRTDTAYAIAQTALDLWAQETGETYNCYEHFMIKTRRGAGWHQFGALSAPVTQWFNAYYVPGTVTTGFNCFVRSRSWNREKNSILLELDFTQEGASAILIAMDPGELHFHCSSIGQLICISQRHDGLWELVLSIRQPGTILLTAHPVQHSTEP